jgi:hypothetical protein
MLGGDWAHLPAGLFVLRNRAEEALRFEQGLSYHVQYFCERLTSSFVHGVISSDCFSADVDRARDLLLGVLRGLADEGPSAEELLEWVERCEEVLTERALPPNPGSRSS